MYLKVIEQYTKPAESWFNSRSGLNVTSSV
jgi:hypothetical protein